MLFKLKNVRYNINRLLAQAILLNSKEGIVLKTVPNVFISYSQENPEHKAWVKGLADFLLENGVDAIVDQYDLEPGDRLPQFMERITSADYVLVICTPQYKQKSDARVGGVGYESNIISAELFSEVDERKFIPIIRIGNIEDSMPNCLMGKLAIVLTGDNKEHKNEYDDLLATLKGRKKKPMLRKDAGSDMHSHDSPVKASRQSRELDNEPVHIVGIITDEVTVPKMDGTRGSALYKIPFRLSKSPSILWREIFINEWNCPPSFTTMHRPGIASVYGDEIILDGTTIEEVQEYHRDTLVLCVNEANKKEEAILEDRRRKAEAEAERKNKHAANVEDLAGKITF